MYPEGPATGHLDGGFLCFTLLSTHKLKIPRPLSQATTSNHHNVFTFTLPLSEGRAGEAWEPRNKLTHFSSPQNQSVTHFVHDFPFSPTLLQISFLLLFFWLQTKQQISTDNSSTRNCARCVIPTGSNTVTTVPSASY
jgi:hypothetical protein